MAADALSRFDLQGFRRAVPTANPSTDKLNQACLAQYSEQAARYAAMAIAPNTQRTYSTGDTRYLEFCQLQRLSPFPATDIMLCCFPASLASKVRPTSVRVYLNAIRNMHLELGYEDHLTEAMLLNGVVKGIGRHHGTAVEKPRLPITFPILRELINTCRRFPGLNHHDKLCLQAAMLAIFFGVFRCGELLSTGVLRSDVSFASGMLHVHVSRSKTDQLSKGTTVVVAPAVPPYCPVRAMINYLASTRQGSSAPLFVLANDTHLTRSVFTAHVRTILSASGVHNWDSYVELQDWGRNNSSHRWPARPRYQGGRPLAK